MATIDGLRGIAAVAVVWFHIRLILPAFPNLLNGVFAVDLFFVISGFVVAYSYEARLPALGLVGFLRIRAIRLYPLYAAGILLAAVSDAAGVGPIMPGALPRPPTASSIWSFLLLPDPDPGLLFPLNIVAWSLFFEAIINVLYAATWPRWTLRALSLWLPLSIAFLTVARLHFLSFNMGWSWENAIGGLARIAYGFPLGVLLFRLHQRGLLRLALPCWTIMGLGVLCVSLRVPGIARMPVELAVVFVLIPLTVIAATGDRPREAVARVFTVLGALSYPLYTIHLPVIWFLLAAASGMRSSAALGPLLLLGAIAASIGTYYFADLPLRRRLARLLPA